MRFEYDNRIPILPSSLLASWLLEDLPEKNIHSLSKINILLRCFPVVMLGCNDCLLEKDPLVIGRPFRKKTLVQQFHKEIITNFDNFGIYSFFVAF